MRSYLFEIINIAGVPLEDQELRNAIYSGSWVTSARSIFSKTGCYAYNFGGDYLNGRAIRQDYLETGHGLVTIKSKNT